MRIRGATPLRIPHSTTGCNATYGFFAANDALDGGVVHTVWLYLLVLVAGLAYLWSTRPLYRCLGWIVLSCLLYQASLFFGLMGAAYRLNIHCVVVALVVLAVAGADAIARIRRNSARDVSPRHIDDPTDESPERHRPIERMAPIG